MKKLTGGPMRTPPEINAYPPERIQEWYNKLREYEITGLTPEEVQRLADLQERGLLVELPIKPGTPVWVLEKRLGSPRYDFVRERFVNSFGFATDGYSNMQLMVPEGTYSFLVGDIYQEFDKIGKTVFLTREEAEKALEDGNET